MDFFDRMGEKLVTAGRDVTQKAKDLSGTAKLNLDIKAKEDFIEKQYAQIGKLYYEDHKEEADGAYGQQMQAIAEAFGATVGHAKQLMHGKVSVLEDVKTDSVMFQRLEKPVKVARYHSLAVEEATLPEELEVTARSKDNEVMAMEHKTYPIYGLQFHPESVMTPEGFKMIENFLKSCKKEK